jgi:hypothetical protein
MKTIYTLTLNSLGKIHFASVVKSSYFDEQNDEKNSNLTDDSDNILKKIDVFYCDNRGVIYFMFLVFLIIKIEINFLQNLLVCSKDY